MVAVRAGLCEHRTSGQEKREHKRERTYEAHHSSNVRFKRMAIATVTTGSYAGEGSLRCRYRGSAAELARERTLREGSSKEARLLDGAKHLAQPLPLRLFPSGCSTPGRAIDAAGPQ